MPNKEHRVGFRISKEDLIIVDKAAELEKRSRSQFISIYIVKAAKGVLDIEENPRH